MGTPGLRSRLVAILRRDDLKAETVAIARDLLAIDDRFNLCVAGKKRNGDRVDLLQLADLYEPLARGCIEELDTFCVGKYEDRLQTTLRVARDQLAREVAYRDRGAR